MMGTETVPETLVCFPSDFPIGQRGFYRLRVFEKMALKRIYGHKRDEVTGDKIL
jgi:hypothetical protein